MARIPGYWETSPSGTGLKCLTKAKLDRSWVKHAAGIEVYAHGRYFAITGHVVQDNFGEDQTDQVRAFIEEHVAAGKSVGTRPAVAGSAADEDDATRAMFEAAERKKPLAGWDIERIRREILPHLGPESADSYADWLRIGHILHHQGAGASEWLSLWDEWSQSSGKWEAGVCAEKWKTFGRRSGGGEVTLASLIMETTGARERAELDRYGSLEDRTDAGNANTLIRLSAGDLRFVTERRHWIHWTGECWVVDVSGGIAQEQALRVAHSYSEAAVRKRKEAEDPSLSDADRRRLEKIAKSLDDWALRCRYKGALDAMLALASKDHRVAISVVELDRNRDVLGVANGVADLRTGELRPAARDEFVTRRCSVAFLSGARAPAWLTFVSEITGLPIEPDRDPQTGAVIPESVGRFTRREDLQAYVQRALGYALTGRVDEQKMFFAVGAGANGKNVLLDTVQEICGDHAVSIPADALMATRGDADPERPSPVLASLAGARLAICGESKDGQRLDVALIKRHTGGGYLTARLMRENTFKFEITHKLWLMTNHRPRLDHIDDALRGRLHLIPFDRRWNRPGHPQPNPALPDGDKDLMTKLRAEHEGILAWLVAGAVSYYQSGLNPPRDVIHSTREYFLEEDHLGRWLELCVRTVPKEGSTASDLYSGFGDWADREGVPFAGRPTLKSFSATLKARDIPSQKRESGMFYGLQAPREVEVDPLS